MLDVNKLEWNLYKDLLENHSPNQIYEMSVREALDAELRYQGIIGYTDFILSTIENLRSAEVQQ